MPTAERSPWFRLMRSQAVSPVPTARSSFTATAKTASCRKSGPPPTKTDASCSPLDQKETWRKRQAGSTSQFSERNLRSSGAKDTAAPERENLEPAAHSQPRSLETHENPGPRGFRVKFVDHRGDQAFTSAIELSVVIDSMTMSATWPRVNFGGANQPKGPGERSQYADYRSRLPPGLSTNCFCG